MNNYTQFLESKIKLSKSVGVEVDPLLVHPSSQPHQLDSILWLLGKGRALLGSLFGLGKTHTQIEVLRILQQLLGGQVLIVCPLGVKHQFTEEDGPRLGVGFTYVRNDGEAELSPTPYLLTNYERVRDGHFSDAFLGSLTAVSLDEGSVLRSIGSDTYQQFTRVFAPVPYRFVATATPAPNRFKEIIHYADFLGVMDSGQALTRWFKRDSQQAGNLTIHPQHEEDFWLWVSSWALFLTKPSDLGYSDKGYDLPALQVHWHLVGTDAAQNQPDGRGQYALISSTSGDLQAAAREKKRSIPERIAKAKELIASAAAGAHWLLWHHLEDERRALEKAFAGQHIKTVYGSQELERREELILGFSRGEYALLGTKPEIAGSGCNFQRHCHLNLFLGINYKFQEFIQAIHRTHRFQQQHPVQVHILYTPAEEPIRKELEAKWQRHEELMNNMRGIIQRYGLSQTAAVAQLKRNLGVERQQASGKLYTVVHNDSVLEARAMKSDSLDMILTSIPFGNHYEYSASYNDFGHNDDNDKFFEQLDYLIPELHRALKPGRIAAIHVKDRVRYGSVTGDGFIHLDPFSDQASAAFRKHGFRLMGRITILTDVVRENNQTYRLSYSEMCKDGSKMGVGLPEYVLILRKLPTTQENGYADKPVAKQKTDYSLGRWQVDAHALWRSSGDRLLSPDELRGRSMDGISQWFKARSLFAPYSYAEHIRIGEQLDQAGRLPKKFMLLAPQSPHPDVWTDIVYMRTLNAEQFKRRAQNHICPLPYDIVDRCIERWSMPGEVVYDPFAGIGTVPFRAITLGRYGYGSELKKEYWQCSVQYCKEAEYKASVPTLFSLFEEEQAREVATA